MGLLMGPAPNGNAAPGIRPNVVSEKRSPVKIRGEQAKAMKAFGNALDRLSFDSHEFGYMMTQFTPAIQRRILEAFIAYFRVLSERVDTGMVELMDDEQITLANNAHQVYAVLRELPLTRE